MKEIIKEYVIKMLEWRKQKLCEVLIFYPSNEDIKIELDLIEKAKKLIKGIK